MTLVIEYHNITLKKVDKNLFFINSIYIKDSMNTQVKSYFQLVVKDRTIEEWWNLNYDDKLITYIQDDTDLQEDSTDEVEDDDDQEFTWDTIVEEAETDEHFQELKTQIEEFYDKFIENVSVQDWFVKHNKIYKDLNKKIQEFYKRHEH